MSHTRLVLVLLFAVAACVLAIWVPWSGGNASAVLSIDGSRYERLEQQINRFTHSTQNQPSLAFGPGGDLLIAWQSWRQLGARAGVCFRTFESDGTTRNDETLILEDTSSAQVLPAVVFDGLGRGLVLFDTIDDATRPPGCIVRPLRGEARRLLVAEDDGTCSAVAGARLRDGSVVAVCCRNDEQLVLCRLDEKGSPVGSIVSVNSDPEGGARAGSIAPLSDGGCVLAWTRFDRRGDPAGISVRLFDSSLQPVGQEKRGAIGSVSTTIDPAVTGLDDGGFCIAAMYRIDGTDHYGVAARFFDPDGTARSDPITTSSDDGPQSGVTVAAMRGGRVVIAWNEHSPSAEDCDVYAAVIDRGTRSIQNGVRIHEFTQGRQALPAGGNRPSIAVGPSGQIAVAWVGDSGNGDRSAVNLTVLCPAGSEIARSWRRAARPARAIHEPPRVPAGAWPPATTRYPVATGRRIRAPGGLAEFGFDSIPGLLPDSHCAVGPTHVVSVANSEIRFFKKDGTQTFKQDLWSSTGFWGKQGAGRPVFDPEVIYDPHAGRFMAIAVEWLRSPLGAYLLAVSDDHDPNGSWHKYRFTSGWPSTLSAIDSPTIAVDDKAVYLGADFAFGASYHISIYPKAPLLAGKSAGTPKSLSFPAIPPATVPALGLPVHYGPSPALYMIAHYPGRSSKVRLYAITSPLTSPKVTSVDLSVPTYDPPARVPQKPPGVSSKMQDARFWHCVWRDGSLWACHHQGTGPVTSRWYEIRTGTWPASGSPVLVQTGEIKPSAGASAFMPSITVDMYGNAAICYARSSVNEHPSIARVWRRKGDRFGTMRAETIVRQSKGYNNIMSRFGDYSSIVVDPADGASFWYTHEYLTGPNQASSWVGRFRVQPPTLVADKASLSSATGGVVNFKLDNLPYAGRFYVLVGSVSGTTPGFDVPRWPDILHVALNPDVLTDLVLSFANTPTLQNSIGRLDAKGQASVRLVAPAVPSAKGLKMDFLFVQDSTGMKFASDGVAVTWN